MPRYARWLSEGMKKRGHNVEIWLPEAKFYKLPFPGSFKKWLGYIDQYIVFPRQVKKRIRKAPSNTLFVFTDHALGPWVHLVTEYPHVVHCHDFLAQRAALGEIPESVTGWTGKQYQNFIRKGFQKAHAFISISQNTRQELHRFLPSPPVFSEVIYNGLNQSFLPGDIQEARSVTGKYAGCEQSDGYILHVGGNQWYKNRKGVIAIYNAWRALSSRKLPLFLIGARPNETLMAAYEQSPYKQDIFIIIAAPDEIIRKAYIGARVLLFPSLAEGFGWPIAEAMASGCVVVTTQEAPMTEIGADTVRYIPRQSDNIAGWQKSCAAILEQTLEMADDERNSLVNKALERVKLFEPEFILNQMETAYKKILTR